MTETASPKAKSTWLKIVTTVVVVVALVVIVGTVVARKAVLNRQLPERLIQANGRIEGDQVAVASKFPGRIAKLFLREGAAVTNGQALVQLDDLQVAAKVAQARAAVSGVEAQLEVATRDVDVEIQRGEIYGLIGPDGARKSSLMKAIAGVLTFDAGEVEVFGVRIDSERAAERIKGRIGLMPQGLGQNLYGDLSIEENVDFFARVRMVPEKELTERKLQLLAMTRLAKSRDRPMKQLSGGMKQKLGRVCTLIHEPELIIVDEPTTGVDPFSRRDFWAILAELLRERGITALVSTASMDEATRFHRLSLLFAGQVLAQGEPDEILSLVPGTMYNQSVKSI